RRRRRVSASRPARHRFCRRTWAHSSRPTRLRSPRRNYTNFSHYAPPVRGRTRRDASHFGRGSQLIQIRVFIPPPLAGEGGERSEPGGAVRISGVTPPPAQARLTLPPS